MGLPFFEKRLVPSGIRPFPCVARIAVQRLVLRDRHDLHCRHSGVYSGMTWSPRLRVVTPGPTSTTTPAPSCPRMAGNSPSGSAPESVYLSVWQMPVALISTSTSPAFGPSRSTVSTESGFPASHATAALVCIDSLLQFVFKRKRFARRRFPPPCERREHGRKFSAPPREILLHFQRLVQRRVAVRTRQRVRADEDEPAAECRWRLRKQRGFQ